MPARKGITDSEVLDAVQAVGHKGTSKVADELDIKRRSAYYRLAKLEESGDVDSYDVGGSLGWKLADSEDNP